MIQASILPEIHIVKFQKDYRLAIPRPLVPKLAWLKGDQAVKAYLLLNTPGRCRVVSADEAGKHEEIRALQQRIAGEVDRRAETILDFLEDISAILPYRLLLVDVKPPDPAWRIEMPKSLAAILQIHPGISELAIAADPRLC